MTKTDTRKHVASRSTVLQGGAGHLPLGAPRRISSMI